LGKKINLVGQRFGRLKVVQDSGKRTEYSHGDGHVIWACRCDCGKRVKVISGNLRYAHTKSCGCLKKEQMRTLGRVNIKHGENDKSRLYVAWINIKRGGKRIKVCKEWLDKKVGYFSFRAWALDHGFSVGSCNFIVDRIDRRKNYSPSNCRFITRSEMMRRVWKDGRKNH